MCKNSCDSPPSGFRERVVSRCERAERATWKIECCMFLQHFYAQFPPSPDGRQQRQFWCCFVTVINSVNYSLEYYTFIVCCSLSP
jgi:hypothetical protein